jgi:CRISPR-associated endonuclease/helicase Cas3
MTGQDEEQESIDLKSSIFLIEGWNSEIVITTFVQLFQSLITNKKGMLRKFNNISGSIIILDEVQAIPAKYWNIVDRVLNQLCNEFGCLVILMTATKPGILGKNKELANLESYKNYDDRINYTFRNDQSLEEISDIILSNIKSRGRVLAVR